MERQWWITSKVGSPLDHWECREFVKCACTTVCGSSARCTCKGADFKCTLLCKCKCTNKLAYDWKMYALK